MGRKTRGENSGEPETSTSKKTSSATDLAAETAAGPLIELLVGAAKKHGQHALFDIIVAKNARRC